MTPEQAKRILNIDREDDKAAIRRKYHRLMSAFHPDAAGDVLYPASFEGNKIRVMDGDRTLLGYLSLEDDELYFCVIPLLKRRLAQVKMTVKKAESVKAEIDFYFRVEKGADNACGSDLYLETADILRKYEAFLRERADN